MEKNTIFDSSLQCMLGSNEWPVETVDSCLSRVFDPEQDTTIDLTTLNSTSNATIDSTLNSIADSNLPVDQASTTTGSVNTCTAEDTSSGRPSRAAKRRALENIQNIHQWENCSESSKMFQKVARHMEMELRNEVLHGEEKVQVDLDENCNDVFEDDSNGAVDSDESSASESMKDFIVSDDEDVDGDEDSEASFKPSEDEDEFFSNESEEECSDDDTVYESAQEEDVNAFFEKSNETLDR